ncbi:MAG: hypothetical protein ACTHLE_01410 [Agriterribacter sp.]
MLSITRPTSQIPTSLPFPGDINSVSNFLFTIFNRNTAPGTEHLSKQMIEEWLRDFMEFNAGEKNQTAKIERETIVQDFSWDYDDVSDFRMK